MNLKIFAFASWSLLVPILDQFWFHFVTQNPTKSAPRGFQNRSKKWSKNLLSLGSIFWRFLDNLSSQLWGARGSNESGFRGQVGSRSHLGAQMAPRPHPSSIFGRSWSIFDRFWVDFGTILNRFWGRCWSIFVWLLMDNVTNLTNLTQLNLTWLT